MIDIYFFIKSLINLSRNSVRFENSSGNWFSDRLNSVRFYLTVWGMACMETNLPPYFIQFSHWVVPMLIFPHLKNHFFHSTQHVLHRQYNLISVAGLQSKKALWLWNCLLHIAEKYGNIFVWAFWMLHFLLVEKRHTNTLFRANTLLKRISHVIKHWHVNMSRTVQRNCVINNPSQ